MITGLIVFAVCYLTVIIYTSIFYHRALAHNALTLPNSVSKFIQLTGAPLTGIDPKAWVCMHRLHHLHSDTTKDPHSPVHTGFWYTFKKQHASFEKTIIGLMRGIPRYTEIVKDIKFDIHWLNKNGLWYVPFIAHFVIGLLLWIATQNIWLFLGYFLGMASHPIQGFLVNAFGHAVGYRNFDYPDNSKNNTLVAWFVLGEGFQNNHHMYPASPKFSMKSFEFDTGYFFVKLFSMLGIVKIKQENIPSKQDQESANVVVGSY